MVTFIGLTGGKRDVLTKLIQSSSSVFMNCDIAINPLSGSEEWRRRKRVEGEDDVV